MRFPRVSMLRVVCLSMAALLGASTARAQGLPVTFEVDDPRDGLYEAAAVALRDLHVEEQVPITFQVVPCGIGSSLDPYRCVNNTGFYANWGAWMRANPDLIDVGQHGNNHKEVLANLTRAGQLDLLQKGLAEMETWNLPDGTWNAARPFSMAAPFASSNTDTISVLEELAFHTSVKNSGTCHGSSVLDVYCESVPLCELNAQGGRVSGPSCVIKPPETLIQEVNARASEGKVFIVYHAQDVVRPDLETVDPAKIDALRAVLQAFRDQEIAGVYDLMTLDTHYRLTQGVPTPGPGTTPTQPSGPTPTPTPPAPTPTPAPGEAWIYQETLASPWIDASWSASVDFQSSTRAFTGTQSIRVVELGWGALSLHSGQWSATQPIDPSRYSAVELALFPEGPGMNVAVLLENDAGDSFPIVSTGLATAGAWKRISVPMSQLNPSGRPFDRVDILNANGTDIHYSVDDLKLVGTGTTPTPTPTPAATATVIPTSTPTRTPTSQPTATPTPPPTSTPSAVPTATPTAPPAATPTPTPEATPTATPTATVSAPTATPAAPTPTPTTSAPTPTPDGLVIYEESLASPWIDASWNATIDFNGSELAFNGSRSIRVAQVGWGALSLHHGSWSATQPLDPADYAGIELMVFAQTGGFDLSVRLENDARQFFPEIATGVVPTGTWTRVFVPMSTLNPNGLSFDRVDVRNFNGSDVTYFVDDFRVLRQ